MNKQNPFSWNTFQDNFLSRRKLIRGVAGTAFGAGFLCPKLAYANDDDRKDEHDACVGPNPIPGGVVPFNPFGVPVHHNPLNPAVSLADISDPSEITDFDGFVGLTHIRGGGTGTNTSTGATTPLAYQADMGFGQGKFMGIDGLLHRGAFAFV